MKYLGLTQILHWITCALIMASDLDQSNELCISTLDSDHGSISLDSPQGRAGANGLADQVLA